MLAREQAAPGASWLNTATAVRLGAALFVAALTAAAGRFSIPLPFTPVPITLQPVIVLAGAVLLGPRLGVLSQMSFLAAGLLGLPVFAESTLLPPGPLRLLGPTGGYLLSYPLAALVTGAFVSRTTAIGAVRTLMAMSAGLAVIYLIGTSWLAGFLIMASSDAAGDAVAMALTRGLYPFVALDLVKIVVAARLLPRVRQGVGPIDRQF